MLEDDLVKYLFFSTAGSWGPVLNQKNGVWVVFACFFCCISWGYKYLLLVNEWSCAARQSPDRSYCLESWSKLITVRCFVIGLEQLCKDASRLREIQLAAAKIKKLIGFHGDPYCIIGFLVEGCLCKACGGSTMRMSLMWFHIFFCVALFGTSSTWSNASISVRRRHCLHLTPSLWVDSHSSMLTLSKLRHSTKQKTHRKPCILAAHVVARSKRWGGHVPPSGTLCL